MSGAAADQGAQQPQPQNLKEDLKALLDSAGVPLSFQNFLDTNRCYTTKGFARCAPSEEKLDPMVIDACGLDLNFGDKISIRTAFSDARQQFPVASAASSSGQVQKSSVTQAKLPDGAEQRCRKLWHERYNFHLPGGQLLSEDGGMGKMFNSLHDEPQALFIPDIVTMARRSNLRQKGKSGTLLTEDGLETIDYRMAPCTNQPDFYLRVRAFIFTISYCMIANPSWFNYEDALALVDFLFESINCRPDGLRPNLESLSNCFYAMFGEFARVLQNEGTTLGQWLRTKANWQHYWKESIVTFTKDPVSGENASASAGGIPGDIASMVESNQTFMKSMQGRVNAELKNIRGRMNNAARGGDYTGKGASRKTKFDNDFAEGSKWAEEAEDEGKGAKKGGKGGGRGRGRSAAQKGQKRAWSNNRGGWNDRKPKRGGGGGKGGK